MAGLDEQITLNLHWIKLSQKFNPGPWGPGGLGVWCSCPRSSVWNPVSDSTKRRVSRVIEERRIVQSKRKGARISPDVNSVRSHEVLSSDWDVAGKLHEPVAC